MTTCDRCGHGEPDVHELTDVERALAQHFLGEVYAGHGDQRQAWHPPAPVDVMLEHDPHYFLCQDAIRDARRLLASEAAAYLRASAVQDVRDEIAAMLETFPQSGRHTRASWAVRWLDAVIERLGRTS